MIMWISCSTVVPLYLDLLLRYVMVCDVYAYDMLQGNIQRCQQFVARLEETRATLLSITETHRQRVADIISRHQSKRIVKKKERL